MSDLVEWAKRVRIPHIEQAGFENGLPSDGLLDKCRSLRELLHQIFNAISKGEAVSEDDLAIFNQYLSKSFSKLKVEKDKQAFYSDFDVSLDDAAIFIIPIIGAAYELLTSNKLNRVKSCPSCGWIFLDISKNNSRRWCNMETCGSNTKALPWYYRQKAKK